MVYKTAKVIRLNGKYYRLATSQGSFRAALYIMRNEYNMYNCFILSYPISFGGYKYTENELYYQHPDQRFLADEYQRYQLQQGAAKCIA